MWAIHNMSSSLELAMLFNNNPFIHQVKAKGDGFDEFGPEAYVLSFKVVGETLLTFNGELRNGELTIEKPTETSLSYSKRQRLLKSRQTFDEFKEDWGVSSVNFE